MDCNKYAYCGFDCSYCPVFQNKKCKGCKSDDVNICCKDCYVKTCCLNKNIHNCGECNEFPCVYVTKNLSPRSIEILTQIHNKK